MATHRKESVGRLNPRTHSDSAPSASPAMVTVAVLPPRLPPPGIPAPPTGVGMADAFSWDEALNWSSHRGAEPAQDAHAATATTRKASFIRRTFSSERATRNPDLPPFVMRQVPRDVWRRHYAKDKEGNYRGTHAPAQDCLLMPHDVAKWRLDAPDDLDPSRPKTWAERATRGKEALPVYAEAGGAEHRVPAYEADDESTPLPPPPPTALDYDRPPEGDPGLDDERAEGGRMQEPTRDVNTGLVYDAAKEREELKARNAKPERWKAKLKRGLEMASMAGGNVG